jgi:hypothetical protein
MVDEDIDMICVDCGTDTDEIKEFFHVRDNVWAAATAEKEVPPYKVLCVGCLERRLGRQLNSSDFTDARVNKFGDHSDRLKDRLAALP